MKQFYASAAVLSAMLAHGCGVSVPGEDVPATEVSADASLDPDTFRDGEKVRASLGLNMARISPFAESTTTGIDSSLIDALADCDCAQDKFASKYLGKLVTRGGVLPQLLMPIVREGVAADPQVQRFLNMSPAARNLFGGIVAIDNVIKRQVKSTIAEKVSAALPGGSTIGDRHDFLFDGFAGATLGPATAPRTFSLGDQATRWNYILGVDAMWSGSRAIDGVDHGLQLLNTALLLSEWSYAFGLDHASVDGRAYGGLTVQPAPNSPANMHGLEMTPFDPRVDTSGMRFVSGDHTVDFPPADSLEMVTEVREAWQRTAGVVTIDEQARVWRAAARAMARLRPSARAKTESLYDAAGGIFPADAHTASLLFLPGMDLLLDGPFFSTVAQSVRDEANFARREDGSFDPAAYPDVGNPVFDEKRVLGLARLSSALSQWVGQVAEIGDLAVDDTTASRLTTAHRRLKDPVRLALVVLMRELPPDMGGLGEVEIVPGRNAMTPGAAAEVLFHVASVMNAGIKSEFLKTRAFALMDRFATNYLRQVWTDEARRVELPAADIVWIHNALAAFESVEGSDARYPWLAQARQTFAKVIEDWNNRL